MSKIKAAIDAAKRRHEAATAGAPSQPAGRPPQHTGQGQPPARSDLISMTGIRHVNASHRALKANRILTSDPQHPAETAYRMLRTRIMRRARANGWQILGISSLRQNEGKTYTALNLAISIAAEIGQEALILDLDLRRPSIHTCLGVEDDAFISLTDYLQGTVDDVSKLIVCPGIDRLGCIMSAMALERPSDVLASPRGQRLFAELRERLPRETVVIVDLPPLLTVDDALAVAPMIDGLLFVVAEGVARRGELLEAEQILQEFNFIGTVLNKSIEKDTSKDYYY